MSQLHFSHVFLTFLLTNLTETQNAKQIHSVIWALNSSLEFYNISVKFSATVMTPTAKHLDYWTSFNAVKHFVNKKPSQIESSMMCLHCVFFMEIGNS